MSQSQRRRVYTFDPPNPDAEPVVLEFNGEEILCKPTMDGLEILVLTAQMRMDVSASVRAQAMLDFLKESMLDDDQWKKFQVTIKALGVELKHLNQICDDLTGEYARRNPESPVSSSAGPTTSGSESAGGSSSKASSRKSKPHPTS